jgi:cyanophycin synthetase
VPVIEVGQITRVALTPQGPWEIVAAVPRVDSLPDEITRLAYGASAGLLRWFGTEESRRYPVSKMLQDLHDKVIRPITAVSFGGISTVPLLQAAHDVGIPFRHLAAGTYQLGQGARRRLISRSALDLDSAIGAHLCSDKVATADCLRAAGFPAAQHLPVSDLRSACEAARLLGWPVVVKPVDRERSEGVTVGVQDEQRLADAFQAALAFSKRILVEKEVPGNCHRLLVAGGRVAYAISRTPLSMVCDGEQSIAHLIEARNQASMGKPPWDRPKHIDLDALTLDALAANGWSPTDVPPADCRVPLRRIESSEWLGGITDVSADVHPDNADLAVRAAKLFGLRNAGVDLITPDISQPWHENGAIINEMNFAPYFGGNATARAAMPGVLDELLPGTGRILIEAFVGGGHALRRAQERQARCRAKGQSCFMTTHSQTWDADGAVMSLNAQGLFDRALALLLDARVEALLMVVQTTELLQTGLPVDRIDRIADSGEALESDVKALGPNAGQFRRELTGMLRRYSTSAMHL